VNAATNHMNDAWPTANAKLHVHVSLPARLSAIAAQSRAAFTQMSGITALWYQTRVCRIVILSGQIDMENQ
jgi:hypothetical protein